MRHVVTNRPLGIWSASPQHALLGQISHYGRWVRCHPHALKATCAKLALRNGVGIDDLQTYIGWKSLASATAYLRSDETEASAAFGQVWTSLLPA